jgi:hypothetical protein
MMQNREARAKQMHDLQYGQMKAAADAKATQQVMIDKFLDNPGDSKNFERLLMTMDPQQRQAALEIKKARATTEGQLALQKERSYTVELASALKAEKPELFDKIARRKLEEAEARGDQAALEDLQPIVAMLDQDQGAATEQFKLGMALTDPETYGMTFGKKAADNFETWMKAKKAGAEAKQIEEEIKAKGGPQTLTDKEIVDYSMKISSEYNKDTKFFQSLDDAYRGLQSTIDGPTGDLSLVIGYMKMLDPGSVVREGEQEMVRKTAGISDVLWNQYTKVKEGSFLNPGQREDIRKQAESKWKGAKTKAATIKKAAEKRAQKLGLPMDMVFPEEAEIYTPPVEEDTQQQEPQEPIQGLSPTQKRGSRGAQQSHHQTQDIRSYVDTLFQQ